jgi:MerR family transcriptional regulator/heat shock protein HspR
MKRYSLKVLIENFEITPSFVKRLEEAELILSTAEGDEIFYTERDVKKLLLAKDLREMGVNLAGIEVILDMSDRMLTIRREVDETLHRLLKYISESINQREYKRRGTHGRREAKPQSERRF